MTVLPAFEQAGRSFCVPSMALILLVQVQSRVFTAKCSGTCFLSHQENCKRVRPQCLSHAFFYTLRDAFNPRLLPYGH